MQDFKVYILYSYKMDLFYKKYTSNMANRINYHNAGFENFTKK